MVLFTMKTANTSTDIQKYFTLGRPVFQAWLADGILDPSLNRSSAQGETNLFSAADVVRIAVFILLLRRGYSKIKAKGILHAIDDSIKLRDNYLKTSFILIQSNPVSDGLTETVLSKLIPYVKGHSLNDVFKDIENTDCVEIINIEKIIAGL